MPGGETEVALHMLAHHDPQGIEKAIDIGIRSRPGDHDFQKQVDQYGTDRNSEGHGRSETARLFDKQEGQREKNQKNTAFAEK